MAVFTTPFTTPANYTYDSNNIFVSGGIAGLKENLTNVYGRWHMNEISGSNVPDDSGNGRDGTAINAPTWVVGKLNNGLNFNGSNQYVDCGDVANFERTDAFSAEAWIKTSGTTNAIIGRALRVTTYSGWLLWLDASGYLEGYLIRSVPGGTWIQVRGNTAGLNDNAWHHVFMTYTGTSDASGIALYVDGVLETMTVMKNTLTAGTILNGANLNIGGVGDGSDVGILWNGRLDEAGIYNKVVSSAEVGYRYNSSDGREDFIRFSNKPTIYKTAGDSGTVFEFNTFLVTDGVNEGSKGYQLSEDGITWNYWDGLAWSPTGSNDYNTVTIINTNINSFPSVSDKIYVKVFLISDGFQREEIDEIQVTYTENAPPAVDAGTNKQVFDNLYLSPFSDATFTDPDGTIDFARYKIIGEVGVWTNIPQGGYATLIEAVHAFSYQFLNTGVLTVQLQVEDNIGETSEDSLQVTVKKYTKIVNVKDVVTGEYILNFDFNPGDGSGTAQQDSPFTWSWDYGSTTLTIEKIFFYSKQETILVENETELTLFVQASAFLNESKAAVGLMTEDDKLSVMTWFQQGGELITNPTSCLIKLYDQDDVLRYTDNTIVHDGGHFNFSKSPSGLPNEGVYHLEVVTVVNGISFVTVIPVGLMERKLISFEGAVHIDVGAGVTGTDFPKGTPLHPVNNYADAKIIANAVGLKTIAIRGTLVLDAADDISNFTIKGESSHVARIEVNGGPTQATSLIDIEIYGELNGFIHAHHCHLEEITGLRGHIHAALIRGPLTLGGGEETVISESTSGISGFETPIIDMGGAGQELQGRGILGGVKLINKTGPESVSLDYVSGQAQIDKTCVKGVIVVRGNCDGFVDNSGPDCTVTRPLLQDLRDEALGKWTLNPDDNTLTLYRIDGTILATMDLPNTIRTLPSYIGRVPR